MVFQQLAGMADIFLGKCWQQHWQDCNIEMVVMVGLVALAKAESHNLVEAALGSEKNMS